MRCNKIVQQAALCNANLRDQTKVLKGCREKERATNKQQNLNESNYKFLHIGYIYIITGIIGKFYKFAGIPGMKQMKVLHVKAA